MKKTSEVQSILIDIKAAREEEGKEGSATKEANELAECFN